MTFETYPIPAPSPQQERVAERIADQASSLTDIATKLYAAVQDQLAAQNKVVNNVSSKLTRAANGRIKAQAAANDGVAASLYSAITQRIADNGQNLAVQSALLSRLAPQSGTPGAQIGGRALGTSPQVSLGGGGGGAPNPGYGPSIPPGASAPNFTLSPQEILPYPISAPPQSVIESGARGALWLVNCDTMTAEIMYRDDPYTIARVGEGHYVPIRFDAPNTYESLNPWISTRAPNAISRACHSYRNRGDGWPENGDFTEITGDGSVVGVPVGPWPFDENGNYTGG